MRKGIPNIKSRWILNLSELSSSLLTLRKNFEMIIKSLGKQNETVVTITYMSN